MVTQRSLADASAAEMSPEFEHEQDKSRVPTNDGTDCRRIAFVSLEERAVCDARYLRGGSPAPRFSGGPVGWKFRSPSTGVSAEIPRMPEEIFDVVDENDRVIGQAPRREVHARGLLHRAVHVLVFDSRGRVLLQKRSATKDRFPNTWSASASGHVDRGEDYDVCVVREMREEIGLTTQPPPRRVDRISACAETEQEFVWVYVARSDGPVAFEPKEVSEVGWFAPAEVDAWIARAPEEFSPSFRLVWSRARHARP